MLDDDLLDEDEETGDIGIPLFADTDGDVGVLPEEDDDELAEMTITGPDGEEEEPV